MRSKTGEPENTNLISVTSTTGTTSTSAIVRGSCRSCRSTRAAVAPAIRMLMPTPPEEESGFEVALPGALPQTVGCERRKQAAVAQEQQRIAAVGLVHHVTGDKEGRAGVGQRVEKLPEVSPQHRVESDGRLVQDEQLRPAEQRCPERDPGPLPAGEAVDDAVLPLPADRPRRSSPRRARGRPRGCARSSEVLADGQIAVDRWRLGDVADTTAQLARPRRPIEHHDLARVDDLHADDRTDQCRLAGAARTRSPVTEPAATSSERSRRTTFRPRDTRSLSIRIAREFNAPGLSQATALEPSVFSRRRVQAPP